MHYKQLTNPLYEWRLFSRLVRQRSSMSALSAIATVTADNICEEAALKKMIRSWSLAVLLLPSLAGADEAPSAVNPDPWEGFNRKIYAFNDVADRYLLKPVAKGYDTITPQFLEDGIHNIFSNVGEVGNVLNSLLQAKFKHSAEDTGRLLINSTVGLLGFFDVASKIGLEVHEEDFGQTLGYWGVKSGPYVVIPLLGPRTVRDAFGSVPDAYTDPIPYVIDYVPTRNEVLGARVIDTRASLLNAEELVTGDRYIFLRDAYLQRRQFLVNDGVVSDSFGEDEIPGEQPAAAESPKDADKVEKKDQ
ncbi:MAG: rane protein [Verrucomicrobiaceae bacterium]|nr:rane protein [Verrucomicrobiaceae bacterium]